MTTMKKAAPMAAALLAALLAACGGGSDGDSSSSSASSAASSAATSSTASSAASSATSSAASSTSSAASSTASSSAASSTTSVLTPANNATGAYIDTPLQITFDAAPTIGTSGYIYVYKSDGTLVDKLSLNVFSTGSWVTDATASAAGLTATALSANNTQTYIASNNTEVDRIGGNVTTIQSSGVSRYRWVFYSPITVSGNVATIKLHDGKLDYGTSYYVTMDSGVLTGKIGGSDFAGLSASSYATASWKFTTKSAPSSTTSVTVAASGTTADFRTVQGALNWMMNNCAGTSTAACNSSSVAKTISIADGTYSGMLWMYGVNNLTITGATRDGTIVTADNYDQYNPGTGGSTTLASLTGSSYLGKQQSVTGGYRTYLGGGRSTLLVEGADLLTLNQFTLQNSHVKNTTVSNQSAETIYNNSGTLTGSRLMATYMNFFGTQDTIQTKGWAWFYKSLIKGDVDYVWGAMFAALIEDSELRTIVDTYNSASGGYVTEARGAYGYPGIVILNSSLTKESGVPDGATYLSRQAGNFAGYCTTQLTSGSLGTVNYGCNNVAYINTKMGSHIASAGWIYSYTPTITTPTTTQGYRESGSMDSTGATLSVSGRNLTYASSTLDLSGLSTRAKVFAQWATTDGTTATATGWSPTAATCSTSACTTSK